MNDHYRTRQTHTGTIHQASPIRGITERRNAGLMGFLKQKLLTFTSFTHHPPTPPPPLPAKNNSHLQI